MGLHGTQGVIHRDQVTAVPITGRDVKAAEGEAQRGVSVPPQHPLAAGTSWVRTVGKARRAEASQLAAPGMQRETAAVCVGDKKEGKGGARAG
jgi:hypothetical protein